MTDIHDGASVPAGAESALRSRLQSDPSRRDDALALGDLLLGDGRVDEAVALLRRHADDRACGDLLREYLIGERRNDEALALVEARTGEAGASMLVDRAIAALLRGDVESAIRYADMAAAADAGYAPAHNHLGRALFNARRTEHARNAFIRAVRVAPGYAEAWHNLAHALRDAREFEQSEHAYGHALRLRPAYRSALLNRGVVRTALGRHERALGDFQALLALDPAHAEACLNAALCEHLLRRLDDARSSYARAIELEPRNPRAHLQLGRLCREMGDIDEALRHFRGALDLQPRDTEAWAEIASAFLQAGRLVDAGRAITAGLAVAPDDAGLRLEHARLDRREGRAVDALARLRAIDLARLHPRLHQTYQFEMGGALDHAGACDAALAAFARGNELASRSPRAQLADAAALDRQLDAIQAWLARGAPAPALEEGEDAGGDLCFVLGFPRSGSSLLADLLDGHPGVARIADEPTIEVLARSLSARPGGYPGAMETIDREGREALRSRYRESVAAVLGARAHGARAIVDAMPIRGIHAAFVHRLFPRARFVFALRHPCEVAIDNFRQNYAANEVTVHFFSLAETVRIYDRAMGVVAATRVLLPLRGLDVRHEESAGDGPRVLRAMLDFLELPEGSGGEPRAIDRAAVPDDARAAASWQGYRQALEPFLPILRPHAARLGYRID